MTQSVVSDQPLLVIAGPTGSGKSDLALALARRFSGEIVNYDSVQLYRGLDIGSAKIPRDQRRDVPHHLLDVIGPGEELSAGAYARIAREAIDCIHRRGRLPILAGGTGFYLRALLDGLSPAPSRDTKLRNRLQAAAVRRPALLHRVLRRFDPIAATRVHPNDMPKLIRAIEIIFLSGQSATDIQSAPRQPFEGVRPLKLGLMPERKLLYSYLNQRTERLFRNGLIEETRRLIDSGYAPDSKALRSVGYKQAVQIILGNLSVEAAIAECQTKTRQYAKRQITWFRSEPDLNWLSGFGSEDQVRQVALERSSAFLSRIRMS